MRDSLQAEEAREPSPARKAVVERCRAVVVDYSSDVGRVAKQLRKNADRAKLFSGADDVVDLEGGPDHLKGVHRERKATTNALRGVGDVIEQAHEAQSDLASQRETLESGLYEHVAPVADGPLSRRSTRSSENAPEEVPGERRRRRDGRVLRVVFALGRAHLPSVAAEAELTYNVTHTLGAAPAAS